MKTASTEQTETTEKPLSSETTEGYEKSSTKSESIELSDMSTLISDAPPVSSAYSSIVVRFLYHIKMLLNSSIFWI